MNIQLIGLLVDTGMMVLIWTVQLVIYPGFCYSNERDMKRWHRVYTSRVTIIVLPLMVSQLGLASYFAFTQGTLTPIVNLALVIATWGITFLWAIPLHRRIDELEDSAPARQRLVTINWSRTFLWTLILIISLVSYAK